MNYQNDVFISFTHIDNRSVTDGDKGWITRFHDSLDSMLSMRLGEDVNIWRDNKLRGNDILSDEVIGRLKQSAVMVSVLSSRYLKSEWCTREANVFCQNAIQEGGLSVGNKARIVKVVKTPPGDDLKPLPAALVDALGYNFYVMKDETPYELDGAYGSEYGEKYLLMLGKLAWCLKETLEEIKGAAPKGQDKPVVYLGECSFDRAHEHELIGAELTRLGYRVLPGGDLPMKSEADYVAAITDMLSRSALSIHLVGSNYGAVPNGPSQKSVTVLQNELAVARARSNGLKRLIWLPAGTESTYPAQQAFIKALREDENAQYGADLIAGDIEQLKAAIHATLGQIEKPPPLSTAPVAGAAPDMPVDGQPLLYLIYDVKDRDSKATNPVRKLCTQLGFKVLTPAFDGDAAEIRKTKQDFLATCDVVLLFYGAGDEAWKRAIDAELMKLPGYRQRRPLPKILTYLAGPKTPDKDDLIDMGEPDLINGLNGFSEPVVTDAIRAVLPPLKVAS